VLSELSKLQSDKKKLLEELDRHKDCDPEVMEQMKEDTVVAREAANRWTGFKYLFSIKSVAFDEDKNRTERHLGTFQ